MQLPTYAEALRWCSENNAIIDFAENTNCDESTCKEISISFEYYGVTVKKSYLDEDIECILFLVYGLEKTKRKIDKQLDRIARQKYRK